MRAKRDLRDRGTVETAVLDAIADRGEDGMTVLELRAAVDADIESIETALATLKRDGLIEVTTAGGDAVIRPTGRASSGPDAAASRPSLLEWLRERLPF